MEPISAKRRSKRNGKSQLRILRHSACAALMAFVMVFALQAAPLTQAFAAGSGAFTFGTSQTGVGDQYNFQNASGSFGYPTPYSIPESSYAYTMPQSMAKMFSSNTWGGSCFGFSSTDMLMKNNGSASEPSLDPSDFGSTNSSVYGISAPTGSDATSNKVRTLFEVYAMSQVSPNMSNALQGNRDNAAGLESALKTAVAANRTVMLVVSGPMPRLTGVSINSRDDPTKDEIDIDYVNSGYGAHAIIAYNYEHDANGNPADSSTAEDLGNGVTSTPNDGKIDIAIYDNDSPSVSTKAQIVTQGTATTSDDTLLYNMLSSYTAQFAQYNLNMTDYFGNGIAAASAQQLHDMGMSWAASKTWLTDQVPVDWDSTSPMPKNASMCYFSYLDSDTFADNLAGALDTYGGSAVQPGGAEAYLMPQNATPSGQVVTSLSSILYSSFSNASITDSAGATPTGMYPVSPSTDDVQVPATNEDTNKGSYYFVNDNGLYNAAPGGAGTQNVFLVCNSNSQFGAYTNNLSSTLSAEADSYDLNALVGQSPSVGSARIPAASSSQDISLHALTLGMACQDDSTYPYTDPNTSEYLMGTDTTAYGVDIDGTLAAGSSAKVQSEYKFSDTLDDLAVPENQLPQDAQTLLNANRVRCSNAVYLTMQGNITLTNGTGASVQVAMNSADSKIRVDDDLNVMSITGDNVITAGGSTTPGVTTPSAPASTNASAVSSSDGSGAPQTGDAISFDMLVLSAIFVVGGSALLVVRRRYVRSIRRSVWVNRIRP